MARKMIKRSPWNAIFLALYAATLINHIYLSQEIDRTILVSCILLLILLSIVRCLIIPIVKIQSGILYIFEDIFRKPIQVNIHDIEKV